MLLIALVAVSSSLNSTTPQPLEFPVALSLKIVQKRTSPTDDSIKDFKFCQLAVNGRFPIKTRWEAGPFSKLPPDCSPKNLVVVAISLSCVSYVDQNEFVNNEFVTHQHGKLRRRVV